MTAMADPMSALVDLQRAIDQQQVVLQRCRVHADIYMHLDRPRGKPRFTYATLRNGQVQCIVMFADVGAEDGVLCFQLGYAVLVLARGRGVASDTLAKAIDEHSRGLKGAGIARFLMEAVISVSNASSNAVARRIFPSAPEQISDAFSGEPALRYLRLIE